MTEVNPSSSLTHRQRQTLETRRLIAKTATKLFLEQGYVNTTIDAIAAEAGVAVSTVYNAFTNKRGILKAIREAWHQTSNQQELYRQAGLESDPARRLELAARATRQQWESGASMMMVYHSAAAADAEAAAELKEALQGRRTNLGRILEGWATEAGQDPKRSAALFLGLTRSEVYLELVQEWQWTPDDYERWLAETLKSQLLS